MGALPTRRLALARTVAAGADERGQGGKGGAGQGFIMYLLLLYFALAQHASHSEMHPSQTYEQG